MDRVADVELNRRGFLKFVAACTAIVTVPVPMAFAELEKDVDSIRRHPLIKINLQDGSERHFNLDVEKVELVVDYESCWDTGFSLGGRHRSSHMINSPTYALRDTYGTQYLSCRATFRYENDDPDEYYIIELHDVVERRPGQNYTRMDVIGGESFFMRVRDD